MQSGTALAEWSMSDSMEEKSMNWAKFLGLKSDSQRKTLEYLCAIEDISRLSQPYMQVLPDNEKRRGLPISLKPSVEWDTVRCAEFN